MFSPFLNQFRVFFSLFAVVSHVKFCILRSAQLLLTQPTKVLHLGLPSFVPEKLDPIDKVSFNDVFSWIVVSCRNGSRRKSFFAHKLHSELQLILNAMIKEERKLNTEELETIGRFAKKTVMQVKDECIEFIVFFDCSVRDALEHYSELKATFFLNMLKALETKDSFCFERFTMLMNKLKTNTSEQANWEFYKIFIKAYLNYRILGQFTREQISLLDGNGAIRTELSLYDSAKKRNQNAEGKFRSSPRPAYTYQQIAELPSTLMKLELMAIVESGFEERKAKEKLFGFYALELKQILAKLKIKSNASRGKEDCIDKLYLYISQLIQQLK